jgi:DNA-binding SARP family transcriptional activator
MLEIRLLGTFDLRQAGKSVALSSHPAQSLLAYLILTAGTPHRREKLAGLLWPDSLEETARDNLRHALWRVRKALQSASSANCLQANDLTIAFNTSAEYWFDVAALEKVEENASADELIAVLSHYQKVSPASNGQRRLPIPPPIIFATESFLKSIVFTFSNSYTFLKSLELVTFNG